MAGQIIFVIGGILPLILCPVLIAWLPESLSLLALDERSNGRLRELLMRIDPSAGSTTASRRYPVTTGGRTRMPRSPYPGSRSRRGFTSAYAR